MPTSRKQYLPLPRSSKSGMGRRMHTPLRWLWVPSNVLMVFRCIIRYFYFLTQQLTLSYIVLNSSAFVRACVYSCACADKGRHEKNTKSNSFVNLPERHRSSFLSFFSHCISIVSNIPDGHLAHFHCPTRPHAQSSCAGLTLLNASFQFALNSSLSTCPSRFESSFR